MKKLILLTTMLLISVSGFAQESSTKMIAMLKQMQNSKGKIMLAIEGKTYTEKSTFFQNPQGKYIISTDLAGASNTFTIVLHKKDSGAYPFSTDKKELTVFFLQDGTYEVKSGTINLKISGGNVSGTFVGKAQKFKGKPNNQKPEGDLIPFSGSFSGLTI